MLVIMKATATWIVRTCSRVSRCQHFRRGSVLNKTDRKSLRNLCGFKPGQDVTDRRKANSTQHLFNTNLRDVLFQYVPFSEVWIFLTLTVATNIKTYFSTALRPVFGSWHPPPPPLPGFRDNRNFTRWENQPQNPTPNLEGQGIYPYRENNMLHDTSVSIMRSSRFKKETEPVPVTCRVLNWPYTRRA
jgi:hypothetical protein